jgi:peptide deformylase
MILPIVRYGDPVLRKKGAQIPSITSDISKLIGDMLDTMREAQGVGLAAQQIGKALQLALVDVTGVTKRPSKMWIEGKEVDPLNYMPMVLINPVISGTKKKYTEGDGCLSFPRIYTDITRSVRIEVECLNGEGNPVKFEAAGLLGRAIQHEVDHLNGILFIDHIDAEERRELKPLLEIIKAGGLPPADEDDEEEEND